jgi:hypothetical protein
MDTFLIFYIGLALGAPFGFVLGAIMTLTKIADE